MIQSKPQSKTPSIAPMPHNVPPPASPLLSVPTHGDIAQRAYDIYVQNGCNEGQCQQNWQQAEKDLHEQGLVACQAEHRRKEVFAPDAIDPR